MAANIIKVEVGSASSVTGNKSEIASAGPIPGSTPTKVPRTVPSKPNIKFVSVRELENPNKKSAKSIFYHSSSTSVSPKIKSNPTGKFN
jgi:hypothetical protein